MFCETFLGGLITFTYGILDKYLSPLFKDEVFGVENKNLLVISSVILLALGILKLVFYIFSGVSTEKNVDFSFELFGSKYDLTGLVDSGNLLKDPMTLKPVIIVKSKVFKGKFKDLASDVLYTSDQELKGRIRLIPVKGFGGNRLLIGIKSEICLKNNNCNSQTVIAIDEEEGSFGGYDALIPSELVSN